ncbi:MAG TPA: hypothetical protein VFG96_08985 [Jiangellaceae bacterium]|nr:hypothetical protein [Jiangellaceae bacterium]
MALPAPHRAATSAHGTTALLVVEDDDTIGVPLVEGLELEGFETTRVRTGVDAVDAVDAADTAGFLFGGEEAALVLVNDTRPAASVVRR